MKGLSPQQRNVLEFISEFKRENEMPPTRAEISKFFGWKSANAAEECLQALEKKGAVSLKAGISRGIRITGLQS